jgi:protein-disulfide isomerase
MLRNRSSTNRQLGVFAIGVLVGITAGAMSERMGWFPGPLSSKISYRSVTTRTRLVRADTLLLAQGDGIAMSGDSLFITVFTDLQCPYCRAFHETILPELALYGISVHYRHLPIPRHPQSYVRALLVECVGRRSITAARTLVDSLFKLIQVDDTTDVGRLPAVGVTLDEIGECDDAVRSDLMAARLLGVSGTPALLINNVLVAGALPAPVIREIYDKSRSNVAGHMR